MVSKSNQLCQYVYDVTDECRRVLGLWCGIGLHLGFIVIGRIRIDVILAFPLGGHDDLAHVGVTGRDGSIGGFRSWRGNAVRLGRRRGLRHFEGAMRRRRGTRRAIVRVVVRQ